MRCSVVAAMVACMLACATARPILTADTLARLYRPTPSGFVLAHCVHHVPSGSHVTHLEEGGFHVAHAESGAAYTIPKCDNVVDGQKLPVLYRAGGDMALPADYNGWLAYTSFNYTSFNSYIGNFSVPSIPAGTPQVIYIFTGLQNINWIPKVDPESQGENFDIIQPVLQFPGDNGRYWSVKSWYVTLNDGAIASNEAKTTPGDYIFGNMTQTGSDTWYVGSTVGSTGVTTQISKTAPRLAVQQWAYNVLEGYGVTGCNDYPTNNCLFSDLVLTTEGVPLPESVVNWVVDPQPNPHLECHENAIVNSASSVTIEFGNK